jgi:allantoin racemase
MAVHIRIVTPITTQGFRTPEDATQLQSDGVKVDFVNIETGPASIECNYEIMLSQPGTIARVIEAEREGADAVVIDCMGDPGLFGARECVRIPVLGPMQTAMGIAAMMGHKFSVVTVLSRIVPMIENEAAVYGMTGKLASARSVDIPVLELEKDLAATKRALIAEAKRAVLDDGADYIIFGCTGMLGCADAVRDGLLRDGLDVPGDRSRAGDGERRGGTGALAAGAQQARLSGAAEEERGRLCRHRHRRGKPDSRRIAPRRSPRAVGDMVGSKQ